MQIKLIASRFKFLPLIVIAGIASARAEAPAASVEAQVGQAAHAWLDNYVKQHQLQDARVEATVLSSRRPAPACDAPYDITPAGNGQLGHLTFAVRCPNDARTTFYQVRTSVFAKVVVAAADIPARQPIGVDDVTLEEENLAASPDALTDPAALAGRVSRRPIKAGSVVQARFLQGETDVKRGQMVQIVARNQQIEISAPGEAMQNGAKDDVIRVRNTSTGKVIAARVTGPGTVEPLIDQ
ncbi:flagellar basal body P-ring formation chaperone FlgA [Trinickia sp. YCB016]